MPRRAALSATMRAAAVLVCAFALIAAACADDGMPPPFTRVLSVENPPMRGNDVVILQNLIVRSPFVENITFTGEYDSQTSQAVSAFQKGNAIPSPSGVFDAPTANALLALHSCDGFIDPGTPAGQLGYKYKIHIPVFHNRSYEHTGMLFDANNTLLHQFRVRAHGHDHVGSEPWPSFSNTDGLNEFTSNGNTPTGFAECDLNSPEPNATLYGPFPVNRVMNGIDGNAKFVLDANSPIRTGILLHTGLWPGWTPSEDMPNSAGCMHAHPTDIEKIWKLLTSIGVEVRENPFGQTPYPYQPQGIIVIEQVGCQ